MQVDAGKLRLNLRHRMTKAAKYPAEKRERLWLRARLRYRMLALALLLGGKGIFS